MVLVDRQIKALVQKTDFISSFDEGCLTNIGYDVRARSFALSEHESSAVELAPGESAFVISEEIIAFPKNMLGRVVLKNSRIRLGLALDSPVYQPGHKTRIIFRLTNVSGNQIELEAGEKYATVLFEELSAEPDAPYAGTFSDELQFRGMGKYQSIYEKQVKSIEKKTEDLKSLEKSIYSNVLTILSVFVALFSLLTINASLLASGISQRYFLLINLVLLGCITFFVLLLGVTVGQKKERLRIPMIASILFFLGAFGVFFCPII